MATLARVVQFGAPKGREFAGLMFLSQRHKSTNVTSVNYKRGTGGRSSFNGNVVTVFGAKSCLGFHLVNDLAKVGTQVICPYRGSSEPLRDMKLMGDLGQIQFCEIDLRDKDSLKLAMKYSNVVINLIGKQFETRHWSFDQVHVEGARRLARCAKEQEVDKFIQISALNAGKETNNFLSGGSKFLKSKYQGELAVREEFPEATILRPADLCDINDKFTRTLASKARMQRIPHITVFGISHPGRKILNIYKNGMETVKMPIRADDVAKAIVNAVFDSNVYGNTYQLAGPYGYNLYDLVCLVLKCMNVRTDIGTLNIRDRVYPMLREQVFMKIGFPTPKITRDIIERESITDTLQPSLLTIEDLGITPQNIEDLLHHIYRPMRSKSERRENPNQQIGQVERVFSTLKPKTT